MTKLCINCVHYFMSKPAHRAVCLRPDGFSRVNGDVLDADEYCEETREVRFPLDIFSRSCGVRARFFEPKDKQ